MLCYNSQSYSAGDLVWISGQLMLEQAGVMVPCQICSPSFILLAVPPDVGWGRHGE